MTPEIAPSAKGFFVTGTDTEIGKTYTSCLLIEHLVARGYRVTGLKPVASGCSPTESGLQNDDALSLMQSANIELPYSVVNRYAFEPPSAPHIAAAQKHVEISIQAIQQDVTTAHQQSDYVVVEAVGGWKVPLNDAESVADLASALTLPIILVVGIRLGCINHALLTAENIRAARLPIAGWIANYPDPSTDPATKETKQIVSGINSRINEPLIAEIHYNQNELLPIKTNWE